MVLENFQNMRRNVVGVSSSNIQDSQSYWHPSFLGLLRLDVDDCVNEHTGKFGVEGVVRNNEGKLIYAFGRHLISAN